MDPLTQALTDIARAPLSGRALDRIAADLNSNEKRHRDADARTDFESRMAMGDDGVQAVISHLSGVPEDRRKGGHKCGGIEHREIFMTDQHTRLIQIATLLSASVQLGHADHAQALANAYDRQLDLIRGGK